MFRTASVVLYKLRNQEYTERHRSSCGRRLLWMSVVKTTYLIDENGVIVKAMDKVKAAENPAQMLDLLG